MPSEIGNQQVRGAGGSNTGAHMEGGLPSRLVVLTFEDAANAEKLYKSLKELDKKKLLNLEDAVFVTKDADGKFKVDEKMHNEKRSGTGKGAVFGVLIGWMLGGPVLGLAGGAIVGRMIGKRVDLGIDKTTIDAVSKDLEDGHTALFLSGSAVQTAPVLEAFKGSKGKIIETTVEADVQARLERALTQDSAS